MSENIISVFIGVIAGFIALIPVFIIEINHRKRMKKFDKLSLKEKMKYLCLM